jgi:hypothetical protein
MGMLKETGGKEKAYDSMIPGNWIENTFIRSVYFLSPLPTILWLLIHLQALIGLAILAESLTTLMSGTWVVVRASTGRASTIGVLLAAFLSGFDWVDLEVVLDGPLWYHVMYLVPCRGRKSLVGLVHLADHPCGGHRVLHW